MTGYVISVLLFFVANIALTTVIWLVSSRSKFLPEKSSWFINILFVPTGWLIGWTIAAFLEGEVFLFVVAILSFFPNLVLSLVTVLFLDKRYR